MASKTRPNTPTEQNKEDNTLVLYRLTLVEAAVKEVGAKVDKQDILKPKDLEDFKVYIKELVVGIRIDLQRQIDEKADKTELSDLKKLVYSVGAFLGTFFSGAFLYLLSRGH